MKLLEQVREKLRLLHYALTTERSYLAWVEQYVRFCKVPTGFRHPRECSAADVERFLTHLAVDRHVSASTQNQALCAVLFLYQKVLEMDVGSFDAVRAPRRRRLPVVLSGNELRQLFAAIDALKDTRKPGASPVFRPLFCLPGVLAVDLISSWDGHQRRSTGCGPGRRPSRR